MQAGSLSSVRVGTGQLKVVDMGEREQQGKEGQKKARAALE